MRKSVISLCLTLMLSACSWENTLHGAARTPEYMRLQDRFKVDNAPRWRLADDASIALADDGQVPQNWLDAASAGVATVFAVQPVAQYQLRVLWPQAPAAASQSTTDKAGFFDFIKAPDVPDAQSLVVQLEDEHGGYITTMRLHIVPELWGTAWHDMSVLQDSFEFLARSLRGS